MLLPTGFRTGKLRPSRPPSKEREGHNRAPVGHPGTKGLPGPAGRAQGEPPHRLTAAGGAGDADCAHRPVESPHLGAAAPSHPPKRGHIAPAIREGKLRPREQQGFVQGHAWGTGSLGPRAPPGSRGVRSPASLPLQSCSGGAARTSRPTRRPMAQPAGARPASPTLLAAAQVAAVAASGSRSALRATS
jgi:hypothetical protein